MPAVVRLGDVCTGHDACPARVNIEGSPNVFVNSLAVHRVGDAWAAHGCAVHPAHTGIAVTGSNTVYVNKKQLCRIGDLISCGSSMATGSGNVFAGG